MTTVVVRLMAQTATGAEVPVAGAIDFIPVRRVVLTDGTPRIVIERPVSALLSKTGATSVSLSPGPYYVKERTSLGHDHAVLIPDVPSVDYSALVELDPESLNPAAEPVAAWNIALGAQADRITVLEAATLTAEERAYIAALPAVVSGTATAAQGAKADTAIQPSDARLADARDPLAHLHAQSDINGLTADLAARLTSAQASALISAALSALVSDAPTTLDTLGEIADALAADEGVVAALTTLVGSKADGAATTAALATKRDLSSATYQTYATGSSGEQITIGYQNNPGAWSIAYREALGSLRVGPASAADHATPKSQVDAALAGKRDVGTGTAKVYIRNSAGVETTVGYAAQAPTVDTMAMRDGTGALCVGTPTVATHATNKAYVDALPSGALDMLPGLYYSQPTSPGTAVPSGGALRAVMVIPGRSCTVDRLAVQVTSAGSAGALIRVGVYADDLSSRRPGALLLDAGTVDGATTGVKEITTSLAVTSGQRLWLCAVVQGAAVTRPTIATSNGAAPAFIGDPNPAIALANSLTGLNYNASVPDALPASTAGQWSVTATSWRIALRSS